MTHGVIQSVLTERGVIGVSGYLPGKSELAAEVVAGGGCVVWALPLDGTCARVARTYVRETLAGLRVADGVALDAATMVSELAANVLLHAAGDWGRPELYVYRRRERELVVKMFDGAPWTGAPLRGALRPAAWAENGRGFEVVDALTREHHGVWGVHRSRSRLATAPVPGKSIYFGLPVVGAPVPEARDPVRAAGELETALAGRGIGTMHRCQGWGMSVLSVRAEVTVWARRHGFLVTMPSVGTVLYPLWEVTEVAEDVVRCCEELG